MEVIIEQGTMLDNKNFHQVNFIVKHYNSLVKRQYNKIIIKYEEGQYFIVFKNDVSTLIEGLEYHFEKISKKY